MASKANEVAYDDDDDDDYFSCLSEFPPYSSNENIFGGGSTEANEFYDYHLVDGNMNWGEDIPPGSAEVIDFEEENNDALWAVRYLFDEGESEIGQNVQHVPNVDADGHDLDQNSLNMTSMSRSTAPPENDNEEVIMAWKYNRFFETLEFSGGDSDDERIPDFDSEFPEVATNTTHYGILLLENDKSVLNEQIVPLLELTQEVEVTPAANFLKEISHNASSPKTNGWFALEPPVNEIVTGNDNFDESSAGLLEHLKVREEVGPIKTPIVIHGKIDRFYNIRTASDNILSPGLYFPSTLLKPALYNSLGTGQYRYLNDTAIDLKKAQLGLDSLQELRDKSDAESPDPPGDSRSSLPKKKKKGFFRRLVSAVCPDCMKKKSGSPPSDTNSQRSRLNKRECEIRKPP